MKLIVIHHHLNPGGVTRIIQSQVSSLRQQHPDMAISLMAARVPNPGFFEDLGVKLILNEDLDYLQDQEITADQAGGLLNRLNAFLDQHVDSHCLLHVHNLNLGKNPVMTFALSQQAAKGIRLVNHSHDFAEDRPVNLSFLKRVIEGLLKQNLHKVLYPGYDNYHYAVLNSFDYERLEKAGIDTGHITLLPNPVHFEKHKNLRREQARKIVAENLDLDLSKKIITYPVRVIRRKNIGELILFAVIFGEKANWLVTQPPQNPVEIEFYQQWKTFCKNHRIDIVFEAGTKASFENLLTASDVCITTSVREGFGMVFLEPWLLDTPVMGRNISYVTADLLENGIAFPLLYDHLKVNHKGREQDFAELEQEEQMEYLVALVQSQAKREEVVQKNPDLEKLFEQVSPKTINHNKEIVQQKYSLENYGNRLDEIYKKVDQSI
ncbi:MAG: hypothetical protein ACLFPE_04485 [Bacteroidales bacterium]